jgi:hypothetical protein
MSLVSPSIASCQEIKEVGADVYCKYSQVSSGYGKNDKSVTFSEAGTAYKPPPLRPRTRNSAYGGEDHKKGLLGPCRQVDFG